MYVIQNVGNAQSVSFDKPLLNNEAFNNLGEKLKKEQGWWPALWSWFSTIPTPKEGSLVRPAATQ